MSVASLNERFAAVWSATLGDDGICIAVLDGPVDRSHVAFKNARLAAIGGQCSTTASVDGVASGHGTHVASIIFGQHESPIKGIAPRCSGLLLPIFGNAPDGSVLKCTQIELAYAIALAADRGAHIINISGGEFTSTGTVHPILGAVLDRCHEQGVLIVAAAGNDGCDCLHIPAAHPSILAVGAATAAGQPLEWSNWGSQYQGHGLLAMGENVRGAGPSGKITERSGTSSATAIVSGVAGLLMSLDLQQGIKPNGPRIRQILLQSSDPCPSTSPSSCQRYLSGVLNVERAVSLLSEKENVMNLNECNSYEQSSLSDSDARRPRETSGSPYASPGPTQISPLASMRGATLVVPNNAVIAPAGCACGGSGTPAPRLVFALGQIGYSFTSQARVDSIRQHMFAIRKETKKRRLQNDEKPDPFSQDDLFKYLVEDGARYDATSIIWTLQIEDVPVYAISIVGPNSQAIVDELIQIMNGQKEYKKKLEDSEPDPPTLGEKDVERVSVAGVLSGSVQLMTGELLPVIHPELRGMIYWNSQDLAKKIVAQCEGEPKNPRAKQKGDVKERAKGDNAKEETEVVERFLERICFDFRNLGVESRDRAINFVATNPCDLRRAFSEAAAANLKLHTIDVAPSLVCRPGSECWDVRLEYFSPKAETDVARRVHRITVDVSDVVPVVVGKPLYWSIAE